MGTLPTTKVKRKSDGAIMIINTSDFDSEIHTKMIEKVALKKTKPRNPPSKESK